MRSSLIFPRRGCIRRSRCRPRRACTASFGTCIIPGAGGGRRGGLAALAAMFGFGGGPWAVPGDYTVKLTAGKAKLFAAADGENGSACESVAGGSGEARFRPFHAAGAGADG